MPDDSYCSTSPESDNDSGNSASDDPNFDDTCDLSEDEDDCSQQYYRDELRRLECEGLPFPVHNNFSQGTQRLIDRIEERWLEYCKIVCRDLDRPYGNVSEILLYSFLDWLLDQRRGKGGRRLRGTKMTSSLFLYWKLFRLAYSRATNEKLPAHFDRTMRPVLQKLAEKYALSSKARDKTPMDVEDLIAMLGVAILTSRVRFSHGRHRIQVCLFLILMSLSGNRPDSLLKLRYQDIRLNLLRDLAGGPHRILIEFTPEFTKSFQGRREANRWPIPEVLYDPSLIASPHVYLLGLMFVDGAFAAPSLRTLSDLSSLRIEPHLNEQPIPIKKELDNIYLFRPSVRTVYGSEISRDLRLTYSTMLPWLKKIAAVLGLKNFIPYSLRYNAATQFDAHGKYTPTFV